MSEEYSGGVWHRSLQENPHGAQHYEAPCVRCGTLTTRRAVRSVRILVPHAGENNYAPELVAWCDGCEGQRNRTQWDRVANNPDVFPRLRVEARARLAEEKATTNWLVLWRGEESAA